MKKYVVVPEIIHHRPIHVAPPDTKDHYPYSDRMPPDPAIYAPVIAYDCQLLDQEMK